MIRIDPLALAKRLWPEVYFYRQQRDIIYSVWNDSETVVPAGNMLGKDFVAGRLVILFFLSRHPCRIVTTSAKDDHLRVLWGEIGQAIRDSREPLSRWLIPTHRELRKIYRGEKCPVSYVRGMVADQDSIASMQGHHVAQTGDGIPRTLFISDESSSVPDDYFKMARTWANRQLVLGNPWDCANYFYRAVMGDEAKNDPGGDISDPYHPERCYRRVIRITAEDSPNIRLARAQIAAGMEPTNEILVPGVKSWAQYQQDLVTMDPIQQCVSLRAEFYQGVEVRLFPEEYLRIAIKFAEGLNPRRQAKAMGIDAAEGGDSTVWTVIDERGIIYQRSVKTADTSDIPGQTIGLMREYRLQPEDVMFDRGGGGKQHADQIRKRGYDVRTVGFGEGASDPHRDRKTSTIKPPVRQRVENTEQQYVYKNRRAEMYGMLSQLVCSGAFGISSQYAETLRQMKVVPKQYDGEGRLYLPPKDKPRPGYNGVTLKQLLGRSPDELDSLVVAVYCMLRRPTRVMVSAG